MQKPIVISLIISIVSLFIVDGFLWDFSWDLWQVVSGIVVFIGIWYYSRNYIRYARDQKNIFLKDYIIGIGILFMIGLFYSYDHKTVLSFLHCRHHCHIVYESDIAQIFLKYVIGTFLIYSIVFVLQLPEKEWVKIKK